MWAAVKCGAFAVGVVLAAFGAFVLMVFASFAVDDYRDKHGKDDYDEDDESSQDSVGLPKDRAYVDLNMGDSSQNDVASQSESEVNAESSTED